MNAVFEIFMEYGWAGINAIIVCLALFYGGKYLIKKMSSNIKSGLEEVGKTLTVEITEQNKNLVGTIVEQQNKMLDHIIAGHENSEKNHNNMLGKRIELSEEISNALKDIGQIHNAQRVFILEFHNSYQNLSGVPFAKYSCTYEWFDKGSAPIQFKCKDMPFSSLSGIISKLFKSHTQQLVYDNMEEFEDACPGLYQLLEDHNTKEVVYTAMYDRNNIMIGVLVLEYYDIPHNINLNQLHIQAAELTSILNLRYKYLK